MAWPGRWGGAHARWWVPGEQSSPSGPAFQPQGRWSDPDAWARAAHPGKVGCDHVDECDGGEQALGLGVSGAAVGLLGPLTRRWTRRRRR